MIKGEQIIPLWVAGFSEVKLTTKKVVAQSLSFSQSERANCPHAEMIIGREPVLQNKM